MIYHGVDPSASKDGSRSALASRCSKRGLIDVRFASPAEYLEADFTTDPSGTYMVCEKPQIYKEVSAKNPNDLVDVAMAAGEWRLLARAEHLNWAEPWPREWKGQQQKATHHWVEWGKLSLHDQSVFANAVGRSIRDVSDYIERAAEQIAMSKKPSYSRADHNLLDAVFLAGWAEKLPAGRWRKL